jgi:hypothetical protein
MLEIAFLVSLFLLQKINIMGKGEEGIKEKETSQYAM